MFLNFGVYPPGTATKSLSRSLLAGSCSFGCRSYGASARLASVPIQISLLRSFKHPPAFYQNPKAASAKTKTAKAMQ